MRSIQKAVIFACCSALAAASFAAGPNDLPQRKELKRADLSGAPGMEVVTSYNEYHKGDEIPRHLHHGIETGYVIQGTMIQAADKEPTMMETGSPILTLRDAVHGGFKIVGDTPLKTVTVHIVDKDKPLYDWAK
jgi:quercetin dioxygenase-like cupin family protein